MGVWAWPRSRPIRFKLRRVGAECCRAIRRTRSQKEEFERSGGVWVRERAIVKVTELVTDRYRYLKSRFCLQSSDVVAEKIENT